MGWLQNDNFLTNPPRDSSLEDSFRMTRHIYTLLMSVHLKTQGKLFEDSGQALSEYASVCHSFEDSGQALSESGSEGSLCCSE